MIYDDQCDGQHRNNMNNIALLYKCAVHFRAKVNHFETHDKLLKELLFHNIIWLGQILYNT